ncbi:hypothetical protein [Vibrio sp. TRT 29B02]
MPNSNSTLTPEEVAFLERLDAFVLDDSYFADVSEEYDAMEQCDE